MKTCLVALIVSVVFCSALYAQDLEERQVVIDPNAANKTYTSILWQPFATWRIFSGDDLDYNLDSSSFTTYQGSFWHKYGFKLGVSLDIDNNFVGKLYRMVGFLGFKRFSLRASTSAVSGTATWTGDPFPGYDSVKHFESRFSTIELLYDFYFPSDNPTVIYSNGVPVYGDRGKTGMSRGSYIGLMYNSWELPAKVSVINESVKKPPGGTGGKKNNAKEPPKGFYDTVKFHNYGLTIGFDNLDGWFLYGLKNESKYTRGFSFWLSSYFSFWMGWADIDGATLDLLQNANPTLDVRQNTLMTIGVQFDATLGLCYIGWVKNVQYGISLGYTLSAAACAANNASGFIMGEHYFDNRKTEGVVTSGYRYIRHGAVLKIGLAF